MKTKIIIILIALLFSACDEPNFEYNKSIPSTGPRCIETIKIDSCEYIYVRRYSGIAIEHKGNCKNLIHYKK